MFDTVRDYVTRVALGHACDYASATVPPVDQRLRGDDGTSTAVRAEVT